MQDYDWGWRFSLGFAIIPALMFLAGAIIAPDSPNSLLLNGKTEKARKVSIIGTLHDFRTLSIASAQRSDLQNSSTSHPRSL